MKQNNFAPTSIIYKQRELICCVFCSSSLSTKEIQERVNKLEMMDTLLEDPAKVNTTSQFQNFPGTTMPIKWHCFSHFGRTGKIFVALMQERKPLNQCVLSLQWEESEKQEIWMILHARCAHS